MIPLVEDPAPDYAHLHPERHGPHAIDRLSVLFLRPDELTPVAPADEFQ